MIAAQAATVPGSSGPNEDAYVLGQHFAVVCDGATAPPSRNSGCVHDVPWLVSHVCAHLAHRLAVAPDAPLTEVLAGAIEATRADHADTCDLSNPDSPSSTVAMLRRHGMRLDYLVLGDSPVAVRHRDGSVNSVVDDRVEHLPDYSYDSVAKLRNTVGGFWVASTAPQAATQALTGGFDVAGLDGALAITDGTSRLVERYGWSWPRVFDAVAVGGPTALLAAVRAADAAAEGVRGKRFDDATAVYWHIHSLIDG